MALALVKSSALRRERGDIWAMVRAVVLAVCFRVESKAPERRVTEKRMSQ